MAGSCNQAVAEVEVDWRSKPETVPHGLGHGHTCITAMGDVNIGPLYAVEILVDVMNGRDRAGAGGERIGAGN